LEEELMAERKKELPRRNTDLEDIIKAGNQNDLMGNNDLD